MELTEIYEKKLKEFSEKSKENLNEVLLPIVRSWIESGKRDISFSIEARGDGTHGRAVQGYDKIIVIYDLSIPTTQTALDEFCEQNLFYQEKDLLIFDFSPQDDKDQEHELIKLYDEVQNRRYEKSMYSLNTHLLTLLKSYLKVGYRRVLFHYHTCENSNFETNQNAYLHGYDIVIDLDAFPIYVTQKALDEFCVKHSLKLDRDNIIFEP